ncbi:MAG: LysM peptidoglycan-binding domain-containing protein, partial [Nocardioides sp.]|uniref:LysM peptidoglycan-binding domain-containing protein n=1 Tax=Nocardioides sp. TaxID=35761 RepID=UPI0032679139
GRSADWLARVPGTFSGQQALVRGLVQAVFAIGSAAVVLTSTSTPWLAHAEAVEPVAPAVPMQVAHTHQPAALSAAVETTEVIIQQGDTLWALAERHLGAGERWRQLAEANVGRTMEGGSVFDANRDLRPGWTLLVPTNSQGMTVTVAQGDTLWEFAEEAYGDGSQWPRVYQANDEQIEDPHWIYPGQQLVIPGVRRPSPAEPPTGPTPTTRTDDLPEMPTRPSMPSDGETEAPSTVSDAQPQSEPIAQVSEGGWNLDQATVTRALLGGGGLLAAGMLTVYGGRRLTQSRNRRSGRLAPSVAPELRDEAKALRTIGRNGQPDATFFDSAVRELCELAEKSGSSVPEAIAARLDAEGLNLHLSAPAVPALEPWVASSDGTTWRLPRTHQPIRSDRMAAYPAMVTIGVDSAGGTWFVDLEGAGVVQLVGDMAAAEDLARFIAAELALNPWTDTEGVDVIGVAHDIEPLNYGRLFSEPELDIERVAKSANQAADIIASNGYDILKARVTSWREAWVPTITIASVDESGRNAVETQLPELLDDLDRASGRTSIALTLVSERALTDRGLVLIIDTDGQLTTPWGSVQANRLTPTEAALLADLFDDAEQYDDQPMPVAETIEGEGPTADVAGALTEHYVEDRCETGDPYSVLPRPDRVYVEAAATTTEDLAVLAPAVPPTGATKAMTADPSLDADLAEWADETTTRPKLRVLGPVELHAVGERTREVESRPAYYAELAAYLAMHPEGLTPNQVANDFGIQNNTLYTRLGQLRKWLSTKPDTDEWYLPNAQRVRGQQVYRLDDVLVDADLVRRLRARGQARGPGGIEDFIKALELVAGRPFDQQRSKGYGWLIDTPHDHYLTAAIVDIAHVVATHALAEDQANLALWAAEKAILAAPSEDKPRLDLAKAMKALGRDDEAEDYLRHQVFNRSDDDRPPLDASARTDAITRPKNRRP